MFQAKEFWLQNVHQGGDSSFTLFHHYCHLGEDDLVSKHASDQCVLLLFLLLPTVFSNCTCKIGVCKLHRLHIEIVITTQSTITNNTDYRAGIYFVIIMFFELL
jgi:hypothetical protein